MTGRDILVMSTRVAVLASIFAAVTLSAGWATPVAQAVPTACEHRSASHAAEHHQTRAEDSRHHVLRGELPTCGLDDDKSKDSNRDDDHNHIPRRDHPGLHCSLFHGCG
jgi:hypothetical protein